jgi:hypothetical protein
MLVIIVLSKASYTSPVKEKLPNREAFLLLLVLDGTSFSSATVANLLNTQTMNFNTARILNGVARIKCHMSL